MNLSDKEKVLLISQYFYSGGFRYDYELTNCINACNLHTDKFNLLELYKNQIRKDTFLEISKDIEKILYEKPS